MKAKDTCKNDQQGRLPDCLTRMELTSTLETIEFATACNLKAPKFSS